MLLKHTRANDLPNDMNTMKKVEKVTQSICEIDINLEI